MKLTVELIQGWNNGERLGAGCFGSVYATTCGTYAIKRARNDATRDYLEWCFVQAKEGTLMPWMPRVYDICADGSDYYFVLMERLNGTLRQHGLIGYPSDEYPEITEYVSIIRSKAEVGCCDVHGQNVMMRGHNQLVVTDPCSNDYSGKFRNSASYYHHKLHGRDAPSPVAFRPATAPPEFKWPTLNIVKPRPPGEYQFSWVRDRAPRMLVDEFHKAAALHDMAEVVHLEAKVASFPWGKPKKAKKVAMWKQPQLKQQHHMRC